MALGSVDMRGKQPARGPGDDTLRLWVTHDGKLGIAVVSGDEKKETLSQIVISEFNAWALIGCVSLFVGLKLPSKLAKRIRL